MLRLAELDEQYTKGIRDFSPILSQADQIVEYIDDLHYLHSSDLYTSLIQWSQLKSEVDKDFCELKVSTKESLRMSPTVKKRDLYKTFRSDNDCSKIRFEVQFKLDSIRLSLSCYLARICSTVNIWEKSIPLLFQCYRCGKYAIAPAPRLEKVLIYDYEVEPVVVIENQILPICHNCVGS